MDNANPPPYLLENAHARNLLPTCGFQVKPSVQAAPSHLRSQPQTVESGFQFTRDGSYPLALLVPVAGKQDVPYLARGSFFDQMADILQGGVKETWIFAGSMFCCVPARVKVPCGRTTGAWIKIFRFGASVQKIHASSERIFLAATTRECHKEKPARIKMGSPLHL